MKAVVVYYSLEGNTELIADMISKRTGADLIKLIPKKEYSREGFKKYFWGGKSVIFKNKPKLLNGDINLDHYDTVIIGTPVWAGSFTPPIRSFLSKYIMKNKSVYLYTCSAGGDTEKCFTHLKEKLKGNTVKSTAEFIAPIKAEISELEKSVDDFCREIKS
jgi:flavodoxin